MPSEECDLLCDTVRFWRFLAEICSVFIVLGERLRVFVRGVAMPQLFEACRILWNFKFVSVNCFRLSFTVDCVPLSSAFDHIP